MKRSAWMAAAVLSLVSGAGSLAQVKAPPGQTDALAQRRMADEQQRLADIEAAKVLTVNFPGGTVGQYVEALRKASSGGTANIVVSDRSANVPISPINLKGVDVGVAISAIPAAYSGPRGAWHIEPVFANGIPRQSNPDAATTTYSVDFDTTPDYQFGDVVVESISLGRLLNPTGSAKAEADPKVVLTAIDTGLQLLVGTAELKFHPDSSLLFVRGTRAEVTLVASVIGRMTEEATRAQAIRERRMRAEKLRNLAVREAKLQIEMNQEIAELARKELDRVQKASEAGTISVTDFTRARQEVMRAEMDLERAKIMLERSEIGDPMPVDDQPTDASPLLPPIPQNAGSRVPNPGGKRPGR